MKHKSNKYMFGVGLIALATGLTLLAYFGYNKISRELRLKQLLENNVVLEIPSLNIKVPVLEGIDNETLSVAAGHFIGTGLVGEGNYCIAGHNSTIYAEIFNDLDKIQIGDEMYLIDTDEKRTKYTYIVTEYKIVSPQSTEVLNDYCDNRLTIISCTDDGKSRQVIIGMLITK
jgi:sortase A